MSLAAATSTGGHNIEPLITLALISLLNGARSTWRIECWLVAVIGWLLRRRIAGCYVIGSLRHIGQRRWLLPLLYQAVIISCIFNITYL